MVDINIKRCVHYWTKGIEIFIMIASKLQFLGRKNLWGGQHFTLPPPPILLDVRGLLVSLNPTSEYHFLRALICQKK